MTPARVLGAAFVVFGGALIGLDLVALWAVSTYSPGLLLLGAVLADVGVYQLVTNISSMTPSEEVPAWWAPGLAAVIVGSLAFGAALMVFGVL